MYQNATNWLFGDEPVWFADRSDEGKVINEYINLNNSIISVQHQLRKSRRYYTEYASVLDAQDALEKTIGEMKKELSSYTNLLREKAESYIKKFNLKHPFVVVQSKNNVIFTYRKRGFRTRIAL